VAWPPSDVRATGRGLRRRIFTFGDAAFLGLGWFHLNDPIVAWRHSKWPGLLARGLDGGIFTFGDAAFLGRRWFHLNDPIVAWRHSRWPGYWLVPPTADLHFGDAKFSGSEGGLLSTVPLLKWPAFLTARPRGLSPIDA